MSKIVLNDVTNLSSLSVINDNFDKIEQEFQSKVHYRDNPEGEPNTFENDVDLNGNSIYNVENLTVANTFTVNGKNVEEVVDDAIAGIEQSALSAANSATAAANSAVSAASSATSATASAATATTKASETSTSATNAGNSATAAASSATASASSATAASGSATSAASSASTATTQASNASSSASAATTSATNAANSATSSASSATASANSASSSAISATAAATRASEAAASAASVNDVNLVHKAGAETITGVKTFTQPVYAPMIVTNSSMGFRNRIINGDMRIDQRNAGASVTGGVGYTFPVDRFKFYSSAASRLSGQRSTTAPTGFTNSLLMTSLAVTTPAAGDEYQIYHMIEGFNTADFSWGTASAQTVTVSFWVRSSLTGTFSGSINNEGGTRSYVFTYAISAANTWEQKTITIPGDTTGTWVTGNTMGLQVVWDLGSGSNLNGTAGTWASGFDTRTSGAVSLNGTSGATFYITGVQLEAGTVASPFERRDYGRELQMCQRYYEKSYDIGTVPGTVTANAMSLVWCGQAGSGTLYTTSDQMMVEKRSNPTLTAYDYASGTVGQWHFGIMGTSETAGAFTFVVINTKRIRGAMSPGTSGNNVCYGHWTASAEL